ncbi:MAG TPA: hypothetical protein VKU37_06000 [Verrucomicrobiae bacterium]|nr:hypothetical protein [Verrucomicrobiae bacterium]
MNHDDFEKRLQRRPLRQVPAEWREEILATAGQGAKVERRAQEQFGASSLVSRLSAILWPHPVAWAGLAAIWIFIFTVDFSMRENAPAVAEKYLPPPAEVIVEVRQQQRLLVEMMGSGQKGEAEAPKLLPLPRSERPFETLTA